MAPVVYALRKESGVKSVVCVTGQHREMLDQVLSCFDILPDFDLAVMEPAQSSSTVAAKVLTGVSRVIAAANPGLVLVQGDTTTSLAAALAAFYNAIAVGHVEAGLRSGSLQAPFPEEGNRRMTSAIATVHFAPTSNARQNLLNEGVSPEEIEVTGNTAIDAVLHAARHVSADDVGRFEPRLPLRSRRFILMTVHRRESFGAPINEICEGVKRVLGRGDVDIVWPVHPNPSVSGPVRELLSGVSGVHLILPQPYLEFVSLMKKATFLMTDSGGVQEEAPSLGKPVLVLRERTERPEVVEIGAAELVGRSASAIYSAASRLLDDHDHFAFMSSRPNPFGDGHASERISARCASLLDTL